MFRASLCPLSGDRLYRTASGVSLDVLVESGHELSALRECRYSTIHAVRSARVLTPHYRNQHIQVNTTRGTIQSVS